MSRVKFIEPQEADSKVLNCYHALQQSRGSVPNLFKVLGYSEAMLGPVLGVADFASIESKIMVREKQLAYLAASRQNHCKYCLERHSIAGIKAGLTAQQIEALHSIGELANNSAFNEREKLIIRLAEELTSSATWSATTFAEIKKTFSDEEIVELALVTASANLLNRLANGLGIELEPEFKT